MKKRTPLYTMLIIVPLIIAACGIGRSETPAPSAPMVALDLVMSYRPDVQFAPFYVADASGAFERRGLQVTFKHMAETDAVQLVGAGEQTFAIVSAEQVLLAREQGLPVVNVLAWWQDYPIAVAAPADSGIERPQDLAGKHVGFPGAFGASYIGLRALLNAADLREEDLNLEAIGFTQVESLYQRRVEAAVVYANNEPIQLEAVGFPVNVIRVADYVHLASNGLITNEATLEKNPELVRRMVGALLEGIQATIDDPDQAYVIAQDYVEGLAQADADVQKAVLRASIAYWKADRLGYADLASWENMQQVLLSMGLLSAPLDLGQALSNAYLPEDG